MAKNKSKTKRRILIFGSFSFFIIAVTLYTTLSYWMQIYNKYKELDTLNQKYKKLKKKEAALKVDVNKMQDSDYIARYAREKYLYSKDGEFILDIK